MPALLPCPFCGGPAVMSEIAKVGFAAECATENIFNRHCRISVATYAQATREAAAADWNRRSS